MNILALHGFTGCGNDYSPFVNECSGSWHCPDLPGHDRSSDPDCSPEHTVQQITECQQSLKKKPTVLVGYSMGARAALLHATENPSAWDGLILISGKPGIVNVHERAARKDADNKLAAQITRDGVAKFMEFWQQQPLMRSQQSIQPDWLKTMQRNRIKHSPEGLASSLREFGQGSCPDLWPKLHTLTMPVLCLTGEFDKAYERINQKIVEHVPSAKHVIIRDTGHMPHLENPSMSATVINRFLRKFA